MEEIETLNQDGRDGEVMNLAEFFKESPEIEAKCKSTEHAQS